MSVLTARYAGTCTSCGSVTHVGDRVRWTRGEGVRHLNEAACDATDDYSLGSCGCTDYHVADCPTRGGYVYQDGYDYEDHFERWPA